MVVEALALGVLGNGVYDFIKMGLQLNAANLRAYFTNQQQPITEQYAQQIIDNIKADNLVQKINNGEITQNTIERHIKNTAIWKELIDQSVNITATNSNVHTGSGNIHNGDVINTGGGTYIKEQHNHSTTEKKH